MDDLRELHKRTVSLLAAKAANYALPESNRKADTADNHSGDESEKSDNILNIRQLFDYLTDLYGNEKENASAEASDENNNITSLRQCLKRMNLLKERYEACKQTMNDLISNYDAVTEQTSSLHNVCDRMMAHQTQIAAGAEQIRANLYYYTQCDIIMKKLISGKLAVTNQSFMQLLATIDECLTFLHNHPHYKDSSVYITKYEQCLSKAITAIRTGVILDLEACYNAVRDRQSLLDADSQNNDEDEFALLYGVFAVRAASVQSSIIIAEQRFAQLAEFQSMAFDCQQAYFNIRRQLVEPVLQKTIEQLLSRNSDSSCALTRNGCAFLLRLCDDEFRLYKQFFNLEDTSSHSSLSSPVSKAVFNPFISSVNSFDEFIESLCRIFYDVLRPIIIHNPHLETLAELCTILKVEMIEKRCGLMISMAKTRVEDDAAITNEARVNKFSVNPRSGFMRVMNELVGDIAERIVYRTSLYIQSDIIGFNPSSGDLAYPDKLLMMKKIEREHATETGAVTSTLTTISVVDLHCLWYPTVSRSVVCLSKLFKCLESVVFQSIARDLLKACCESLEYASESIKTTNTKQTSRSQRQLDADLFIVKHLLILREQTSPYRATASGLFSTDMIPERAYSWDLGKYKKSASHLLFERQRWFELTSNNAFLELLFQVPIAVSESSGDSRRIIDLQLKKHCHALIQHTADIFISEVVDYVNKFEAMAAEPDFDISKLDFLKPNNLQDIAGQASRKLKHCWPEIRSSFDLYIGVKDTEDILLQPIKKRIADIFGRLTAFVEKYYDAEQKQIACIPSQENIWLIINS